MSEAPLSAVADPEVPEIASPSGLPTTRPANASRMARRAPGTRKVTRYTLDLETETHRFLRLFAVSHDVDASKVMRGLLYLLEAGNTLPEGRTLAELVLEAIDPDSFAEPTDD